VRTAPASTTAMATGCITFGNIIRGNNVFDLTPGSVTINEKNSSP
jgi:hypothetical protein